MKPNDAWTRPAVAGDRVVLVEESTYVELLISRRRLHRAWDRPSRLIDLETREIFVRRAEEEARRADVGQATRATRAGEEDPP
jgi:hypothetical protein